MTAARRCVAEGCGVEIVSGWAWGYASAAFRSTRSEHKGFGLCRAHYARLRRYGSPTGSKAYSRGPQKRGAFRKAEEVLEDWEMIRDDGCTDLTAAAARMNMSREALAQALYRARRRGDDRGSLIPFAHDLRRSA